MVIFKLLAHCTIGAYLCWAFGVDEGGGWKNWKEEFFKILTGKE